MISQEFKNALKLYPIPKCQLAWKIGISSGVLYHLINGHQRVHLMDKRLLRIADLIRFPRDKVFEMEATS